MEKDKKESHLEVPPWDKQTRPVERIKEIANNIKGFFIVLGIVNSAEIEPRKAAGDVKSLARTFIFKIISGEDEEKMAEEEGKKILIDKKEITGNAIKRQV